MVVRMIEKIDECEYCNKKAKYLYSKFSLVNSRTAFLCEDHKKEFQNYKIDKRGGL